VAISSVKATFNIFSCCDYFVPRWAIRGDTTWYGLKLYIVISPEKQGYGVTTDAAAVHSSMHRSLEDVVFGIFQILIISGTKRVRRT